METDVIVIGAGAAGLAAARSLARRPLRVAVLEARPRTGGRAWTQPLGRTVLPAELGAEFIHGPAHETHALLREAGMVAVDTGGESWSGGAGGELQQADDFSSAANIFDGARSLSTDESVEEYLQRFDRNPKMRGAVAAARAFVEGFDAADPALASVRGIAAEWDSGVDLTSARPFGGYGPLFAFLERACSSLGVVLRTSTVVRRIAWRHGAVTADALQEDGSTLTVRARAAVVTLPVGVLRHGDGAGAIFFEPDLPAAKRVALGLIENGDAVRVGLRFATPFWEEIRDGRYRDAGFFRRQGQPFNAYWTQMPVRGDLITAWAGGPNATALSATSSQTLIERALEGFGAMFGEPALARREFQTGVTHDWHHDPYSRGAYSYLAVGAGDARAVFAAPVDGTLFFAGEATSNDGQGGTVNGAFETGERAAGEAVAALGATA